MTVTRASRAVCWTVLVLVLGAQPTPEPGQLPIAGIVSVYPPPGSSSIPVDGAFRIRLAAVSYFQYIEGNKFRVIDAETGDQRGPEIQFKPGDAQEGSVELVLPFAQFNLLAGSSYYVTADRGWTRINAEPWIIEAIAPEVWGFKTAGQRPVLTRPDAFSFTERRDVPPGVIVQSGSALIQGVNVEVPVRVDGGEYSINGAAFTSAPGTISRKQTIRLRGRSADRPGSDTDVKLQVGDGAALFRIHTAPSDGLPRGFAFLGVGNAAPGMEYESEEITVSGLDGPAPVSITGGAYSLDRGGYTAAEGRVTNGQSLKLRVRAPLEYDREAAAVVRIGDASADFTVRTPLLDPAACRVKSIAADSTGRRDDFNFPNADGAEPGEMVTSACVKIAGIGARPLAVVSERALVSINNGPYSLTPGLVKDGDELRVRLTAPANAGDKEEAAIEFEKATSASFAVRTRNNDRDPAVFQVGPTRDIQQIADLAGELREGDVVEVDGDAVYDAVKFQRPGAAGNPIIIRGITVNGKRPVIAGGTHTVHFQEANHYRFENFEVTGGDQTCVRVMADGIVVRDVWIHGCVRHGILGADFYTGSVTLDRIEVSDAGGQLKGENLKHGVYIATDRDRYPGSRLRIQFSHIHDIRGDAVKSRAERNEIYYNWIDTGDDPQSIYTLELLGYQEYTVEPRIDSDIAGNVLVHRRIYGIRLGGDGTGASRGRVRLANNTFVAGARFDPYTPMVRLFQALDSVLFVNNAFVRTAENGGQAGLRLLRVDEVVWTSGQARIAGRGNWLPTQSPLDPADPKDWADTQYGTQNPGLNSVSSVDDLDVSAVRNQALWQSGVPPAATAPGYEITHSLNEIRYRPPAIQPAAGQPLALRFAAAAVKPDIGAQ